MKYRATEDSGADHEFEAENDTQAEEMAIEWCQGGDYPAEAYENGTFWIGVAIERLVEDEDGEEEVEERWHAQAEFDPTEPDCPEGDEHDWQAPHELVGGCEENPGVRSHGGGVIIEEVCICCGATRTTDTWAQDSNGRQGLESVKYGKPGSVDVTVLAVA